MAAKPEAKAKKEILKRMCAACTTLGYTMDLETHAGDAFSTPTLDITGTLMLGGTRAWGVPFAIEVKRFDGKGKLTGRQAMTIRRKHAAGVAVFLIEDELGLEDFLAWLRARCPWRECPNV